MLPKNPMPMNLPPRRDPVRPSGAAQQTPGKQNPPAKTSRGPQPSILTRPSQQPATAGNAPQTSALQSLNIKPIRPLEEGKENEVVIIERLLKELSGYDYLYNSLTPNIRELWDSVKSRAAARDTVGGKDVLIADIRKLINLLESKT